MEALSSYSGFIAQFLIAAMFLNSAIDKIRRQDVYVKYMIDFKIAPAFLPITALLDGFGGLCILIGLWINPASLMLAGYVAVATVIFHFAPRDVDQMNQFFKNAALVGGLLLLAY